MPTTIKLRQETKRRLDTFREHPQESYDVILNKLAAIAENAVEEPELSTETMQAIREARRRMQEGRYVSETELRKRFGIDPRTTRR